MTRSLRYLGIKRVDLLIGLTVLGWILVVWLMLVGLDAVIQFLRQLRFVGQNGYTVANAAFYVAVTIPRRMYEMYNSAALIGSLLGMGGLAATGELTVMRAAGMSRRRIVMSGMAVVTILVAGVMVMGETIGPIGDQLDQMMQARLRHGEVDAVGSGLWARDGERIINARRTVLTTEHGLAKVQLFDVRIYSLTPDGQLVRFDHAATATHTGDQWVLHDVRSSSIDTTGIHSTTLPSEQWSSRISPRVLEKSMIQPQYLSMRDQWLNMRYLERNHEDATTYAVPFWGRVLYPLNVLVLVACALPMVFGSLRSGTLGKRIFAGILLALAWYFGQQAIVTFGVVNGLHPLLANLLPAIVLAMLAWFYFGLRNGLTRRR
ncbi:LPS export ABC transporter permease LptG [Dyella sp. A6]|uniref:LPS export ABC transporter permease LptG n=1 Tax=Dyella aluminiiresistens TaxID=3069105 RepID=UPI002E7985E4|nr:LPS export ABC transporter permease LptG [Dyella sp. A6]